MEIADVPDGITVPSMTVGYARTGDILYLPQGSMTATKAINGDTLAVRSLEPKCSNRIVL